MDSLFLGALDSGVGHRSLKLPERSASEGTNTLKVCPGTRSLRHSCDQKKKVLSFLEL